MINNRNVNIITDEEGNRIALIKDIRFRGKQNIDWRSVKAYLEGYKSKMARKPKRKT